MSRDNDEAGNPAWRDVSLGALRGAPVPAAVRENDMLNPEAATVAASLSHPRLNPSVILAAVRAADVMVLWMSGLLGLVAVAPRDTHDMRLAAVWTLALAVAVVSGIALSRGYRLPALRGVGEGWARAAAVTAAAVALTAPFVPFGGLSATAAIAVAHLLGLLALRLPVAGFVDWALRSRVTERRAVIVGGGGNAERLIRGLAAQPDNDIRVVAMFDDRGDDRSPPLVAGCRKLGTVAELLAFARVAEIDMVIVTLPLSAEQRILSLLKALWVLPVDIRLSAYSSDYAFPRRESALIGVTSTPLAGVRRTAKRLFDVLAAALALIVLSPVMLLTALAIRLETPGPVLFIQRRHGFNHRPVEVWKFRSMHHAHADPLARRIVTRGDPRVTRVGRFIRKTSIDELPQLFNVLMGDLSLVGPRPHAVDARSSRQQLFTEIVEGYSGRHRVPPGITGWAQISGWRGEVDDPEKLRQRFEHDLYYIENWSLWLDLKILLLTPLRLLDTRNAY